MDLRPPTFEDDLDTRLARLLFWLLWTCIGVGIPYLVISNIAQLGQADSRNAAVAIGAFVAAQGLLYRGHLRGAATVAAIGLIIANTLEAIRMGGPSMFVPLVPNAVLALALAAAVLRTQEVLAVISLQVVLVVALFRMESQGIVPEHPVDLTLARLGAYSVAVLLTSGFFLTVGGRIFRGTVADLQLSEGRYRNLVDQLPDGVVTLDANGVVASGNPAAARILGLQLSELVGGHFTALGRFDDSAAALEGFQQMVQGDRTLGLPVIRLTRRDGERVIVEANPTVIRGPQSVEVRVVIRDVTERIRGEEVRAELENQLLEARRLESIGRLAGGVAHDFNNLLTVILSSAELLKQGSLSPSSLTLVDEVDQAAVRAADLTGQLLTFARRQVREPRAVDLDQILVRAQALMARLVREDIELQVRPAGRPVTVFADPLQLEQVLVNLVVNGRDAMGEGGRLTVETGIVDLSDDYALQRAGVQPGRYAMLAVSDTGDGMDAETRTHIFEPFFSTKGEQGTGLGLATVHGIVRQSGGHVFVYSEPRQGTTFKVYLPLSDRTPAPAVGAAPAPPSAVRSGTILVVDDEPAVLATVVRILERFGYVVLSTGNPRDAIALSQAHKGRIDLLLTDVVMPAMGGVELAEKLSLARPGLKVLYTSGYTENAIVHRGVLDDGIAFLAKPFSPRSLGDKLDELLRPSAS